MLKSSCIPSMTSFPPNKAILLLVQRFSATNMLDVFSSSASETGIISDGRTNGQNTDGQRDNIIARH